MASRPKKVATGQPPQIIRCVEYKEHEATGVEVFLMAAGGLALASILILVLWPLGVAAGTTISDYYWPPPITSFHYLVTVHEDGASGDITAAGTGSVGK